MSISSRILDVETDLSALQLKTEIAAQDFRSLKQSFDVLSVKLGSPGTKFLVGLQYRLVYDATVSVPGGGTNTLSAVFETLPSAQHAFYIVSAYAVNNVIPILVTDGPFNGTLSNSVTVSVKRELKLAPPRVEASVLYRSTAGDASTYYDIAVRIYRHLGL